MFYSFKNQLFAALLIVVAAIFFNFNAAKACPNDPNVRWEGTYSQTTKYRTAEGCEVIVTITWCYGRDGYGLHYVAFDDIKICVQGCDPKRVNPEEYYKTETIDNSLIAFSKDTNIVRDFLDGNSIPDCPASLCYLQVYDAKCYRGWVLDPNGCWIMDACNDEILRRCCGTIRICYNTLTGKIEVQRLGISEPDPCIDSTCKVKCF